MYYGRSNVYTKQTKIKEGCYYWDQEQQCALTISRLSLEILCRLPWRNILAVKYVKGNGHENLLWNPVSTRDDHKGENSQRNAKMYMPVWELLQSEKENLIPTVPSFNLFPLKLGTWKYTWTKKSTTAHLQLQFLSREIKRAHVANCTYIYLQ